MKKRVIALLIGVALSGCTAVPGPLTQTFGTSRELVRWNQILNPAASANLAPVEGLDGKSANLAIERYYKSFERVPTQPRFVLRVGDVNVANTAQ